MSAGVMGSIEQDYDQMQRRGTTPIKPQTSERYRLTHISEQDEEGDDQIVRLS